MTRLRRIVCLLLLVHLLACASRGPAVDRGQVGSIQLGVTTQQEVLGWWGEPDRRKLDPDGSSWLYVRGEGGSLNAAKRVTATGRSAARTLGVGLPGLPGMGRTKDTKLVIAFDAQGIVTDYRYVGD